MSAIPAPVVGSFAGNAAMPRRRLLGAYMTEARYETIRMLRTPAFAIPFLALPVVLYLLFGVVIFGAAIAKDPQAGLFIFTGFTVFGVMGPGIFGFGMVVAVEREQGLVRFKRALPMPPAAYLLAKLLMAMMFSVIIAATMLAAAPLGHLKIGVAQGLAVAAITIAGVLPFCAIGFFIGTRTTSRSAPAFVNIAYQIMMHVSGIFYPLPQFLRTVAPVWPSYHVQQLLFGVLGMPSQGSAWVHASFLAGVTVFFTMLSLRRLERVG